MTTVRMIPPIGVRLSLSRMKRDIGEWRRKDKCYLMANLTFISGLIGGVVLILGYGVGLILMVVLAPLTIINLSIACIIGVLFSSLGVAWIWYSDYVADQIMEAK